MTPPRPISTLFALSTFGCVIEPGVLEGDDDVGESDGSGDETDTSESDTSQTGEPLLDECLRGTNPAGGSEPNDFPIADCDLTCDVGWGHEPTAIPIAWTLHFEALEPNTPYFPVGVIPRSSGDGVVVVSRREHATELLTVSSSGAVLDITSLPTDLELQYVDAAQGVIHLTYYDDDAQTTQVVAVDEHGEPAWSASHPAFVTSLAAAPDGVIMGSLTGVTRLNDEGSVVWSMDGISVASLEISPQGNILVGGYEVDQLEEARLVLLSPSGELLETVEVPGSGAQLWDIHFLTERRFYASGTTIGPSSNPGDGSVLVVDLDEPEQGWSHTYNRAVDSCDDDGMLIDEPTWDWFGETAMLADGTLLVVGAEAGPVEPEADQGLQPRVVHLDRQGEFLAGDRGLWFGQAQAVAADDEGSAYVAMTIGGSSSQVWPISGFHLRKYLP